MKTKAVPLINFLVEKFQEYSEKELYSFIMCGEIKVGDETVRDPRRKIKSESSVTLKARKWVSRGGEKLEHALVTWNIDVSDKVVVDAGSSTGGFTDCLLQRGAGKVHAVDVGYNQLDYKLRTDKRVNVLEKTNIMSVKELEPSPAIGVADLSFRSIKGAASHILRLTTENLLIALIKPQFELPDIDDFDGIIRDRVILHDVLRKTAKGLEDESVKIHAILESPIRGGKGNIEFLFKLSVAGTRELILNREIIEEYLSVK